MNLGALPAINTSVIKERITQTASDPTKVQTFATQTQQTYDPTKGVSPLVQPATEEGTDYMAMLKKYAPYIIGAIVLYYILKNKK